MKKNLLLLFLMVFSILFSQDSQLEYAKANRPLYLFNNTIGSQKMMSKLDSKLIKSAQIFKEGSDLEKVQGYEAHLKYGIIMLESKEKFSAEAVLLSETVKKDRLPKNTPVYIDGFLVTQPNARIYLDAIVDERIIETQTGKVLNIWTLQEDERRPMLPPVERGGIRNIPTDRPVYIRQIE